MATTDPGQARAPRAGSAWGIGRRRGPGWARLTLLVLLGSLVASPAGAVDAVTGASPSDVPVGQPSYGIWITGRGFVPGTTVTISGDGFGDVGRVPEVVPQRERFDGGLGDGLIVAVSVAANATNGPRDVTIRAPDGRTVTSIGLITVVGGQGGPVDPANPDPPVDPQDPDPPPAQAGRADVVARASPRSGNQGEQVNLWVVGRSFAAGSTLSFSVDGLDRASVAGTPIEPIVYRNVETINGESYDGIQYFLRIATDARPGGVDLTVTNPDGSSASAAKIFEITEPGQSPAPIPGQDNIDEITSASPRAVRAGSPAALWILGTGFATGAEVSFSKPSLRPTLEPEVVPRASNTPGQSGMRVHLEVGLDVPPGPVDVAITNPNGTTTTAPGLFTVLPSAGGPGGGGGATGQLNCPNTELVIEALNRVVPATMKRGEVLTIAIQGVAFACGASVVIGGGGMRALGVPQLVTDADDPLETTMFWQVEVARDAAYGPRDVLVVNPNNSSKVLSAAFVIEGDIATTEDVSFCSTAPGDAPPGPLALLAFGALLLLRRRRA